MSSDPTAPLISVVIPAYNEAKRLPKTLQALNEFFHLQNYAVEVIVVDDGSTDQTAAVVSEVVSVPVRLLRYEQNRGKGYAVRQGVLAATGYYVLLYDADGATPMTELPRLLEAIQSNLDIDIAIGSRAKPSSDTHVEAHLHRKIIGRVFAFLVMCLVPGIYDTQCGFKLFVRERCEPLFQRQMEMGYAFDVETLVLARDNQRQIVEVPINWQNVSGSKVNVLTDSVRMLLSLWRIQFRRIQGQYRI